MWLIVGIAVLVVVGILLFPSYRRGQQLVLEEREKRARRELRARERAKAARVLAEGGLPLENPPVLLRPGETAYYQAEAAHLAPEGGDRFRKLRDGQLVVSNRAAYFVAGGQVVRRHGAQDIERIDFPFIDVLALVSFRDTLTRDEERTYYQLDEPLVAAAHIARFTAFELILD